MTGFFGLEISGSARAGMLSTAHGRLSTPCFMPVGTQGSVKALAPDDLQELGYGLILGNAYHLYLRPGLDVIRQAGGLHRFMGWDGAILTDSGGYQVFSLPGLRRLTDDGVVFRSHIDGSEHFFSPEKVMEIEEAIGADIIMALDECPPSDAPESKIRQAVERTNAWAKRCQSAQSSPGPKLFGIVQGGLDTGLRRISAEGLIALDLPGYAIGGLSLGEAKDATWQAVEATVEHLPVHKPRYLMGVGSPEDIVAGVARGIDMFDSVLPTRVARNGALYTHTGRINIRNAAYRLAADPVEADCACYTCQRFSGSYLNHLYRAREILFYRLATIHNLYFMKKLMDDIRLAIVSGNFERFAADFITNYRATDETVRRAQKDKWLRRRESSF